jgi:hypothetical protein
VGSVRARSPRTPPAEPPHFRGEGSEPAAGLAHAGIGNPLRRQQIEDQLRALAQATGFGRAGHWQLHPDLLQHPRQRDEGSG